MRKKRIFSFTSGTRRFVFKRISYRFVSLAFALIGIAVVRLYVQPHEPGYVFYLDIPPPLDTEIGDRNISQYDFGGSVGNCAAIRYGEEDTEKADRCDRDLENARSFVESHFKGKRRGYVIIDSPNLETGINYIFVEPATEPGDDWEIRIRKRVPGPYSRGNRNINTWYYTEVFWRRIRNGDIYLKADTNALVLRSRGVYELVF